MAVNNLTRDMCLGYKKKAYEAQTKFIFFIKKLPDR